MKQGMERGLGRKLPSRKPLFTLTAVCVAAIGTFSLDASMAGMDYFGDPPTTDPSHGYEQPADPTQALQQLLEMAEPNEGAMEIYGGSHLHKQELSAENYMQRDQLSSRNYPTNGYPSPLFGAQPWTQKLLMFEEFGPEKLDPAVAAGTLPFPLPKAGPAPFQDAEIARSAPDTAEMDAFLKQAGLSPYPTRESNTSAQNPWKPEIEQFLGRFLTNPPAEGRPPGEGWAHQRWNEFYPQQFFKTVQAPSRPNGGLRDSKQLHGYKVGEFGPGGLYHNTAGLPGLDGTTKGIAIRIHPKMPIQDKHSIWTFDGTLPPKLLMVRHGQPIMMRHYNALPIDPAANRGFGLHTISTHVHNGHNPAESDGFANAFFFPGQFYDYRWPLQLAGYDTINTTATDPRASFPCAEGETLWVNDATPGLKTCQNGKINIRGDWRETVSTQWFHDHMLDFTAQNVYKGNAVAVNIYSGLDRGNEAFNDGVNLRFPSGSALPWGNRDYDVNLVIGDKAWDKNGQLWFNPFNKDGFIGDRLLTNWQYAPVLDVRARKYRFRLLNGSVSRYLALALVAERRDGRGEIKGPTSTVSYDRVPFHLIANDGNILEHAVPFDGSLDLDRNGNASEHKGTLPTQAIAERYDIVVDFSRYAAGTKLYFVNTMEHQTGIEAKRKISLSEILSERYKPVLKNRSDGTQEWDNGDPVVGRFLQLVVRPYTGTDRSMNPAEYEPAKPGKAAGKKMVPLWLDRSSPADQARLAQARMRTFEFGRSSGTDVNPWTVKADGGDAYTANTMRISAAPQMAQGPTDGGFSGDGHMEVWRIKSGGGWDHPVHIHFEEGIILSRDGAPPPEWEKWSRKDVYRVGGGPESSGQIDVAIKFREFAGTYVEHCHNTQHEDNAMLLRWDIERPGQFLVMPTPLPTWDGVEYVPSVGIPTFRTGSGSYGGQ